MQVSFYLKRPDNTTETSIFARITYEGFKLKFYTSEKITPKFWSKENHRAKETAKFPEYPEFNARLDNIETDIKNIYRRYRNENGNVIPQPETLKTLLDTQIKRIQVKAKAAHTFMGFFEELIKQSEQGIRLHPTTGKPIAANTLKTYRTTFKHLSEFQRTLKRPISFDSIDLDFYNDYTEYLIKKLKLSTNTIGKHIQIIKLLMNEATERGINTNLSYKSKRFVTVREKTDSIYLNVAEIKEMESLDLSGSPKLERVRDLFLIGCHTGLRFSDYSILKPEQIKGDMIETTQTKTGDPVIIPVHDTVKRILNKYNGELPRSLSNQKTNSHLKEIGQMMSSLNSNTSKTFTKAGSKVTKSFNKWELLTTHTARRSFASNEFLAGTPPLTIMAITGHKTEKAFLKYIKLSSNEHAKLLKMHWQKRGNGLIAK